MSRIKQRPAENAGAASGGLVALIAAIQGHNLVAALSALAALAPHVVTYVALNGGVKGVLSSIWRGR